MIRNTRIIVFALVVWLYLTPQAQSQQYRQPQLMISKVTVHGLDTLSPTLGIDGNNFGPAPSVYIGGTAGSLIELTVLSASNTFISARLTGATSAPGTYVLVVSRGPSTNDVYSVNVTLGAGGGAAGSQGIPGATGPAGPTGPMG